MLLQEAIDEFLLYLEIEKTVQKTLLLLFFDLKTFADFLVKHYRLLKLNNIHKTLVRRCNPEQITKKYKT
jgi:integrase/recombinase XerD